MKIGYIFTVHAKDEREYRIVRYCYEATKLAIKKCDEFYGCTTFLYVVDDGANYSPMTEYFSDERDYNKDRIFYYYLEPRGYPSLTRSWNYGIKVAQAYSCDSVIIANADTIPYFATPIRLAELSQRKLAAGPTTNGFGHIPLQNAALISAVCTNYYTPKNVETAGSIINTHAGIPVSTIFLNGFYFAIAKNVIDNLTLRGQKPLFVDNVNQKAYITSHGIEIRPWLGDPKYSLAMIGQEDEFFMRGYMSMNLLCSIDVSSYVFHFKSAFRPEAQEAWKEQIINPDSFIGL